MLEDLKSQYKYGGVVTKLIYWNVLFFLLPLVVGGVLALFRVEFTFIELFSLSSSPFELINKPWSIISYGFFHGGFVHFIFNMITLYYVGILFQTFFTQKQLIGVYFMGIIFSGLFYIVGYLIFPALMSNRSELIGASGAIMSVLLATASYSPYMEVRLLLLGRIKLWHIAAVLVVINLIQLPYQNTGGLLAHLGGALFGYIYVQQLKKGNDWAIGLFKIIDGTIQLFKQKKKSPFVKVHRNESKVNNTKPLKSTQKVTKTKNQKKIDEILDKISQSGYESLSKEEKEFLFQAGKNE